MAKIFESQPEAGTVAAGPPNTTLGTIDDPPEASPEADADTARQLSRALVVNRVGNSVDWEAALQRLGLDVQDSAFMMDIGDSGIALDSTKRKRRKKMKKHKYAEL